MTVSLAGNVATHGCHNASGRFFLRHFGKYQAQEILRPFVSHDGRA
jgi:hypothetical protein